MIPMFRVRSRGTDRMSTLVVIIVLVVWRPRTGRHLPNRYCELPAVVSERLVCVSHLVDVFALLDRVATVLAGVDDLVREAIHHRLLVACAGVLDQPAHAERERAVRANVDGNLVGRTTDAAALDLDARANVRERALPDLQRIILRTLGDHVERLVDDALGNRLLAVAHDDVDELGQPATNVGRSVGVLRVREDLALGDFTFTGHTILLLRALRAVLGARLLAVLDARRIEGAADDVVANAREILDATAADQDDRVLLQIVSLARDVRRHFHLVRQTNARDLAEGRVRLLRGRRVDAGANATLLRALLQGGRCALGAHLLATLTDELIDSRHADGSWAAERARDFTDSPRLGEACSGLPDVHVGIVLGRGPQVRQRRTLDREPQERVGGAPGLRTREHPDRVLDQDAVALVAAVLLDGELVLLECHAPPQLVVIEVTEEERDVPAPVSYTH